MIRDHAVADRMRSRDRRARIFRRRRDQMAEQIDVVIVMHALQHRRELFEHDAR